MLQARRIVTFAVAVDTPLPYMLLFYFSPTWRGYARTLTANVLTSFGLLLRRYGMGSVLHSPLLLTTHKFVTF